MAGALAAAVGALAGCGQSQQHSASSQPSGATSSSSSTASPGPSDSATGTAGSGTAGTVTTGGGGGAASGDTQGRGHGTAVPPGNIDPGKPVILPSVASDQANMSSVAWTLAGAGAGGQQLVLSTETTPCRAPVASLVTQSGDTITVGLLGRRPPAGAMCAQYMQQRVWSVRLPAPLKGKHLAHLAPRD